MICSIKRTCALLSLIVLTSPAMAVDGVIEINQVKAMAGGVSDGDIPGFPVSVTTGGSYRLTGNLVVTGTDERAITLSGNNITFDLNGFSIIGPNTCNGAGSTISCALTNGALLIAIEGQNITVRNGTLRGSASAAIGQFSSTGPTVLESLTVTESGSSGAIFSAGELGQIRISNCRFIRNKGSGLEIEEGAAQISHSMASRNGSNGLNLSGRGFQVDQTQLTENGAHGIQLGNDASEANTFLSNILVDNEAYGVSAVSGAAFGYGGNQIDGNVGGTVEGTAFQLSTNICDGNTSCP